MKRAIASLLIGCATCVAIYAASPYFAARAFVRAARSGDADKLEASVDFPAVRDNLKAQLNAALIAHLENDPELNRNPFARLGMALAPAFVGQAIDAIVTPEGIAALVRNGKLRSKGTPEKATDAPIQYSDEYLSLDRFRMTLKPVDGGDPAKLIFERRGLLSWKLIKIEIPENVLQDSPSPDLAAPSSAVERPANSSIGDTAAASFALPSLPTPIIQIQCHMGECIWQQIQGVEDVKQVGTAVLRVVHSRIATTETPQGRDYPSTLDPAAKVEWRNDTSYDLCSVTNPAAISWDPDAGSYLVTPLNVLSPFGYQIASVAEYKMACHGIVAPDKDGQDMRQLGYSESSDPTEQSHIKSPDQIFSSLSAG